MFPNWHQSHLIKKDTLENKFVKIGFSQNGEDDYIRSFFLDKLMSGYIGKYLDIGCYHESLYSNTKILSLFGWTGVAVDANPSIKNQWLNGREKDDFFNIAISKKNQLLDLDNGNSKVKLYRFKDQAINTIDNVVAEQKIKEGFEPLDTIEIDSISLDKLGILLTQQKPNIKFDFLNIDIEQVDYLNDLPAFLKAIDFPDLICMEWISKGINLENFHNSREAKILKDSGYLIRSIIADNAFAVNQSINRQLDNKIGVRF